MIRLAITMRIQCVSYPSGSVEERDALSSDWYAFLSKALPNALFLPLPNIGSRITSFLSDLHITEILCSGGDEWGKYPRRDDTEKAALTWSDTCHSRAWHLPGSTGSPNLLRRFAFPHSQSYQCLPYCLQPGRLLS